MNEKITLSGNMFPVINFAMQQNYVPIIRNLIFTNITTENIDNVKVVISFEPEFAHSFETTIGTLEPEKPIEISPVKISIIPDYLLSLTEKMVGNIHINIFSNDEKIHSLEDDIELLAYDQWSGALIMPEIICAFITPNHPKITEIIRKAGVYLQKWLGTPSFTAYQSQNPNVVKNQMAAIYAALQEENIAYTMPPASYEEIGQRVRYPHMVLEQKMGTCIDLSTLYASCLEAVGLNPIIIIIKGHAFCGCWLDDQSFSESVQDDVSVIGKRIAEGIDEICLVECTDFVAGAAISFDGATRDGNAHLDNPHDFLLAADVVRSRASGIRPTPMRTVVDGIYQAVDYGERKKSDITNAPSDIDIVNRLQVAEATEITKQKVWERKLLDLSLRNMLLSFRVTKTTVQLMAGNLATLEDALSDGDHFRILPKPTDWVDTLRDSKIYSVENEKDAIEQLVKTEFQNKRIRTFFDEQELTLHIKSLHRNAKLSLEENGSNTLYLALGFLRWFESDISEKARYAPLVLIPVELTKKVSASEYILRIRDEEPQMNITLLEMLKQEHGIVIDGLDPLPADQSGIDLKLVFTTIRQAVMNKKRWDVQELAFLGLFSFSQYIMWNDIRTRSNDLAQNKIVSSLISGKMEWEPEEKNVAANELDQKIMPSDLAVPTSADSSQLTAIFAAASGSSFVLHGPPGTGKSQTITNVIANALFQGKSVLFVAQKMAALSVVQKRLADIGLAPFSLELHSNKARKKDVLDQLQRTLEIGRLKEPDEYLSKAEQLKLERDSLNKTIDEIHKKRHFGFSLYESISKYEECASHKGKVLFSSEQVDSMNEESFFKWKSILDRLCVSVAECVGIKNHPLSLFNDREYSITKRDNLISQLMSLSKLLDDVSKHYYDVCDIIRADDKKTYNNIYLIKQLADGLLQSSSIPEFVLKNLDLINYDAQIRTTLSAINRKNEIDAELAANFHETVFDYNVHEAILRYRKAEQSWILLKSLGIGKLVKELKVHALNPVNIQKENLNSLLEQLLERDSLLTQINNSESVLCGIFKHLWCGVKTDEAAILKTYEDALLIQDLTKKLWRERDQIAEKLSLFSTVLEKNEVDSKNKSQSFVLAVNQLLTIIDELISTYKIKVDDTFGALDWLSTFKTQVDIWIKNKDSIREWMSFLQLCDEAENAGIKNMSDAIKNGAINQNDMMAAFECNLFYGCITECLSSSPELSGFQGVQMDESIRRFKALSKEFSDLTIRQLVAKLSAKIPTTSAGLANSSEIGILQRTIKSGGRMMPIRKLFDSVPNLIHRLCPCMLMSPISVAQYIDPSFPKFDLVIFDEASQIPTCEAVGAIARGENALVVGDPKQLPPTSFFSSNRVDEENFDKEDLESLLDDCLALTMPQSHLLWHYRSRHESLIAYSNQKYYDNKLFTFPSPNDLVSEVVLIPVDGVYDRGNTKQNRAEAEKVVAEICKRISDPILREDSIGVVTFSSVQQNLIDDLLSEAFRKNPELEEINNSLKEPLFIKNLENVQGDERDIILFSIGYGPDKDGKVAMNFGPLNRDGGWRRLNVAISRARKRMEVYSTLKPEQIDLSRTRAEGIAGLKGFLEFAAGGKSKLAQNNQTNKIETSKMEQIIADKIKALGFDVKCNIGCSGYKIDIGVVNAEKPDEYILGIMCDGDNYLNANTANDRNIVQPLVLKSLGWNLHRIWILDWLDNPEKELKKIEAAIAKAKTSKTETGSSKLNKDASFRSKTVSEETPKAAFVARGLTFEKASLDNIIDANQKVYTPLNITNTANPETFYLPGTSQNIIKVMSVIIEKEAPVSRKLLGRKVLSAWGIARAGSNVDRIIEMNLRVMDPQKSISNNTTFFWKADQKPSTYFEYRVSVQNDDKRSMDDICAEEIANAIKTVMQNQISLTKTDLTRETAKVFGFTRLGSVIESSVQSGIDAAVQRGYVLISENGERITLSE